MTKCNALNRPDNGEDLKSRVMAEWSLPVADFEKKKRSFHVLHREETLREVDEDVCHRGKIY